MKGVYLSTAIDLVEPADVARRYRIAEDMLRGSGFRLVNAHALGKMTDAVDQVDPAGITEQALSLIYESDFVLTDLSRPNHTYIGCICEMVYAYLWQKPIVVLVGHSGNEWRPWLRFHASHICTTLDQALDWLCKHAAHRESGDL